MRLLEERVAIVTGGGGNIGSATAKTLAREGCRVIVADIDPVSARACAESIRAEGNEAQFFEVDLTDDESIRGLVEWARATYGALHILHNNAAAMAIARLDGTVDEMEMEVWNLTMAVNLRGPMLTIQHAIPLIRESGGGSIVNTVSNAAAVGNRIMSAYGSSKAGLIALTKYVATQHGKDGIRCNAVQPGYVQTDDPTLQEAAHRFLQRNLVQRFCQPEDLARAVAFLASDEASFITGQTLIVDGGATAHGEARVS